MGKSEKRSLGDEYSRLQALQLSDIPQAYNYSCVGDQLARQYLRGLHERYAVFSDIDNTLQLAGHESQTFALAQILKDFDIPLIAITGLDVQRVRTRIEEGKLPTVPMLVTTGGLHIWAYRDRPILEYQEDDAYSVFVRTHENWSKEAVESRLMNLAKELPQTKMILQRDEANNTSPVAEDENKVAAYFYVQDKREREQVTQVISENFPGLIPIICSEITHNKNVGREEKFCLDLSTMDKLGAVLYLQKVLGITKGLAAGDSGNDSRFVAHNPDMLGIAVGGYKPELREAIEGKSKNTHVFVDDTDRRGPESIIHGLLLAARTQKTFGSSPADRQFFSDLYDALRLLV